MSVQGEDLAQASFPEMEEAKAALPIEFIRKDECVEITPESVRLRKADLDQVTRVKAARARARGERAATSV